MMANSILDRYACDLFDVVETNGAGFISASSAIETLCLLNPALTQDYAVSLINLAKPHDRRRVDRDAFVTSVHYAFQNTNGSDALRVMRDFTQRLRLTHRRRYLMMDAPANTLPAAIAGNPVAMALFRELFDVEAHGSSHVTRAQLRGLLNAILPDSSGGAADAAKAALAADDSEMIGFHEFVHVMQPITARRPLSELVEALRGAPPSRGMEAALQQYRQWDADAGRRWTRATPIGTGGQSNTHTNAKRTAGTASTTVKTTTTGGVYEGTAGKQSSAILEEEVTRLRLENETLQHDLLLSQTRRPSVRIEDGDRVIEMRGEDYFNEENDTLRRQLTEAKDALRQCHARIDMHEDVMAVGAMLRRGLPPGAAVLSVYPDESALMARYQKLVQLADRHNESLGPPDAPARLLLTQLDAIARGYQALYRQRCEEQSESALAPGMHTKTRATSMKSTATTSAATRLTGRTQRPAWVD